MAGKLLFRRLSIPGQTAPLTFYPEVIISGTAELDGTLGAIGWQAIQVYPAVLEGQLGASGLVAGKLDGTATLLGTLAPTMDWEMLFDLNVPSGPGAAFASAMLATANLGGKSKVAWQIPKAIMVSPAISLKTGERKSTHTDYSLGKYRAVASAEGLTLTGKPERGSRADYPVKTLLPAATGIDLALLGLDTATGRMLAPLSFPPKKSQTVNLVRAIVLPRSRLTIASMGRGRVLAMPFDFQLSGAIRLVSGYRSAKPSKPEPVPQPVLNRLAFHAAFAAPNILIFNRSGNYARTVTIRRVYLVTNTFAFYRALDGHKLPVDSLDLKDRDGDWCWSLSGSLADYDAGALLAPGDNGPTIVHVHVNGEDWEFIIDDDPEGEEQWDSASASFFGRSRTALFDAPYYPSLQFGNAEQRLFSQIANDLFIFNGASLGVEVSTNFTDWLIPANLWSFNGTPVAALKRLASAPGAMVSSSKTGLGFSIDLRYPSPPWEWADETPYATIPRGYWIARRHRAETKPPYDLVIVSGDTADGVLLPVQRTGSAGIWRAPDQVDRLMTAQAAALQRGKSILADVGRQSTENIIIPFGSEFGLLPKGALVEFEDRVTWRGRVRSVGLSCRMQGEAFDIEQVIEVERHHG